jgi:hypothetical protein
VTKRQHDVIHYAIDSSWLFSVKVVFLKSQQ